MLCSPLNSDSPSHLYNSFFKDKVLSPKPTADSCCISHSIDASHRNSSLSTASPSPTRGFPIRYQCTMPNTKTFISQIPTKASLSPPPSSPFKHHPPSPSSHDAIVYVLCLSLNITPPSLILVQTLTLKSPWLRSGRLNSPRLFVIYLIDLSSVAVSCEISIRVSLPGNYNDNSIKCYS